MSSTDFKKTDSDFYQICCCGVTLMKLLHIFDKKDYDNSFNLFHRDAVRSVILKGEKLALIFSRAYGYYKFSGGGIDKGETHLQALIRETKEEAGLSVISQSVHPIGMIRERRRGILPCEIFEHDSYYYYAEIEKDVLYEPLYDEHEMREDYVLRYVCPREAAKVNNSLAKKHNSDFILREAFMMDYIFMNLKEGKL